MEQKLQRYGPLGAIAGIILVLVSFGVHGRWASTEESPQEIADLYVQNQDRVFMGSWLAILGALCMLVFGMCMSQRVRDTGQQLLGMLVAGATLIAVAGMAVDSTLRAGLSIQAENMSPEAMKTMHAIWDAFFWPMHAGMATLVLAIGLAALSSGLLPKWLGWIGVVAFVVAMIPAPTMFAGIILSLLFMVITALMMTFGKSSTAAAS
ncbi:MAG TPA: hypothetical protein DCL16_03825 [Acidimicrobiaceae bacterium]|nr:hypothetical protein [Acidimicrobiaceae bacterium]